MNKVIVTLIAVLALTMGCANWANMTVEQKTAVACDASIQLVKPECARLGDNAGKCETALDAAQVACHAAIQKDVTQVCPAIAAVAVKCNDIEDALDRSTCQRIFVAANVACIVSTSKASSDD